MSRRNRNREEREYLREAPEDRWFDEGGGGFEGGPYYGYESLGSRGQQRRSGYGSAQLGPYGPQSAQSPAYGHSTGPTGTQGTYYGPNPYGQQGTYCSTCGSRQIGSAPAYGQQQGYGQSGFGQAGGYGQSSYGGGGQGGYGYGGGGGSYAQGSFGQPGSGYGQGSYGSSGGGFGTQGQSGYGQRAFSEEGGFAGYGDGGSGGFGGQGQTGQRAFSEEGGFGGYGGGGSGLEYGRQRFGQHRGSTFIGQRGGSQEGSQFRNVGRGPKGYKRSDERICEDVSDRLSDGTIDASEITVNVQNGEVTLAGTVESRHTKFLAENMADSVPGVKDVHNQLRVVKPESRTTGTGSTSWESQRESGEEKQTGQRSTKSPAMIGSR